MKESTIEKYKLVVDEWFVNGFNGTKAHQKYYPDASKETSAVKFNELVRIDKILTYKENKLNKVSEVLQLDYHTQILKLENLRQLCMEEKKYSDALNVLKEQSKLSGLYEKNNRQKYNNEIIFLDVD